MLSLIVTLFFVVVVTFCFSGLSHFIEAQQNNYSSDLLFIALFSNGDSQISNDISFMDVEQVQASIPLFGYNVSGIRVIDNAGNPIEFVQQENNQPKELLIESPNKQDIRIAYQTSNLTQHINKKWVFSINSSFPFTLKLPINSTILDWNVMPISFELLGEQHLLSFNPGNITMNYIIEYTRMEDVS
jgi:hypothetical protein